MVEKRFWNEQMETMPIEEMKKLQLNKLKKQIKYCYDNSPLFYKKKFDEAGAAPEDIKTMDDFRNLPIFLNKEEDRRSQDESLQKLGHSFGIYLCAPLEKVIGVNFTSGTTGVPTFYPFTRHDIDVVNEVVARGFWRMGVRPGDSVLHGFGLSMWVAGIPIIRALEHMGVLTIPAGAEAGTERFLQIADLMRPTVLACTPSFAMFLIEEAPKVIKKEVKELGIKKIFCAGEPGAGLPDVKKKIEEAYGAVIYDAAGVAWGLMNISCGTEEYHGMHVVTEDYNLMYDLVDPDTNKPVPIENGAVGRGVISQLDWEAAPILRYDLGDICQVYTDPCSCGLPGYRIKVLGRSDDMLIVKGINVYPAAVKNVVNSFVPRVTGEMRIMLDAPPPRVVPPLNIRVEHGPNLSKSELPTLKKEMEEKISREVRTRPVVELVPPNTLKRAMEMGRQKTPLIEIVE